MAIQKILTLQGILFLLVLTGIILKWTGLFPEEGKAILTDILIYVFLPANIVASFLVTFNAKILIQLMVVFLLGVFQQVSCLVFNRFAWNHLDIEEKKVLQYCTLCSNSGFIGLSIIGDIFGAQGLMYASVGTIPQAITTWSAGISYFEKGQNTREVIKRVAIHPGIIAVYLGLFFMLTGIRPPVFVSNTLRMMGACTLPVSMIVIGAVLGEVTDIKSMLSGKIWYYTIIRLVFLPLIVFITGRIFHVDKLLTGIIVLVAAMPAASTGVLFAAKYKSDYIFATKCVVVTTALSLITIPLWCLLL
ncbi:MAG: AEC family transporter [Fusobacteriaceae bacterium]|jgi:predicted permease|nr:AEC family transporter [Fusobacteriaceae bacterium]